MPKLDLAIAADGEATLPALIEACKRLITPDRKRALEARGAKLAEVHKRNRDQVAHASHPRLGLQPDHSGAHLGRAVGAGKERRLVASFEGRIFRRLADQALGF